MALQAIPDRDFKNPHGNIAVILSEYHEDISRNLLQGFAEVLKKYSGVNYELFKVPGAFEIPYMAQEIGEGRDFSVMVALGCIIKGDTYHFEQVANESARGCMEVMLKTGIPIVYEVLSVYRKEDAEKRSQGVYNHGKIAAQTALYWLEHV